MLTPLVSIVIPTFNHARYLGYAISSAINQDYPNLEIIVVDDGSYDGTAELIKPYRHKIKYIYKSNRGTPHTLNVGLALAKGKYICWLSADDYFLEGKVSRQVRLMESNPEMGFSYTGFRVIDANGKKKYDVPPIYYPDSRTMVTKLMEGCFINGSSVMMSSSALKKIGNFDENLHQAHDYDMWFRFLRHYSCGFLDECLLAYRWHGENMSQNPDETCTRIVKERAKRLFPEWLG